MESSPSNISKSLFSNNEESQESGWTTYFEDFFNSAQKSATSYNNSIAGGNSVISDAASSSSVAYCKTKSKRKLSFKKKKAVRGVLDDDSLEDTASSPIGAMDLLNMNPRKKDEHGDLSQEKDVCFQNCAELRTREGFGFVDNENECKLKKRGLCLVPLSMLVDYLG